MYATNALSHSTRFKTGWISLVTIAALTTLSHFSLIFFLGQPSLFTGYAAFNFYSLMVLLIPFRRFERWAWWTTWALPLGLVVPAVIDPNLTLYYAGMTVVCVLGLLLTARGTFSNPENN